MKNKKLYTVKNSKVAKPSSSKSLLWVFVTLVLILALAGVIYRVYFYNKSQPGVMIPTTTSSNKAPQTPASNTPSQTNSSSQSSKSTGSGQTQTVVNLSSPSGNFVSSHHIGESDSVESTCNTTPGAKCSIIFTNDAGAKLYLAAQTIDQNGTAYWNWTPAGAKMTSGTWHVQAVATSGSQTKTTKDPTALEVSP